MVNAGLTLSFKCRNGGPATSESPSCSGSWPAPGTVSDFTRDPSLGGGLCEANVYFSQTLTAASAYKPQKPEKVQKSVNRTTDKKAGGFTAGSLQADGWVSNALGERRKAEQRHRSRWGLPGIHVAEVHHRGHLYLV